MTITRLTGNAVTYGGYVNVSRQDIDFSIPDHAGCGHSTIWRHSMRSRLRLRSARDSGACQQRRAGTGAAAVPTAADTLAAALWTAAANVYTAVKGVGRLALIVPPSRLGNWGPLFAPVNPQNAQSTGFNAGDFGSGVVGNISGIPVVCSPGYPTVANHYGSWCPLPPLRCMSNGSVPCRSLSRPCWVCRLLMPDISRRWLIESTGVQRIVNPA